MPSERKRPSMPVFIGGHICASTVYFTGPTFAAYGAFAAATNWHIGSPYNSIVGVGMFLLILGFDKVHLEAGKFHERKKARAK